jgi:murein DD-endopeptidase MepM/ murein hydrolase activator NlpD
MRHPRTHRLAFIVPPLLLVALLSACGGGTSSAASKPTASGSASDGLQIATLTPTPQLESTPTATPAQAASATPEAAASPTPEAQSDAPSGLSFDPPQLQQGGYTVAYLDEAAVNATLDFGGRQYPMLQDGARWWAVIGVDAFAEPGLAPVTVDYTPADGATVESVAQSIEIVDYDYPVENIDLDPETSTLLDPAIVNNELAIRSGVLNGYTMQKYWSGPFLRPSTAAIGDVYGIARSYNGGPVSGYHHGVDFTGNLGDPVYAAAAGIVVFADELQVRGNTVMLDHGAGVFTGYNHLSEIDVKEGDLVTAGQQIGLIGSTGLVTGPHLHWEVIVRGVEVDGQLWLNGTTIGP